MAECKDSTTNNTNTQKQSVVIGDNDSTEENKTDKVMEEPLMIEDLKNENFPRSFINIQRIFNDKGIPLTRGDYVVLLVHILMLEGGFVTLECKQYFDDRDFGYNYSRILDCIERMPSNWKRNNSVYSVNYVLPPFSQNVCKVTCTEIAEDIVVNSSVDGIESCNYSLLIDPARYVMTSAVNIANKFQDARHLSRVFKSKFVGPIKNGIMKHNNVSAFCLGDLPVEILFSIMRYFDPTTLAKFERTCTAFRLLSNDLTLWKKIPGGEWDSFQHFKRMENAKKKFFAFVPRSNVFNRRLD